MNFRTEIEAQKSTWKINHDTPVLLLGSCFTDEIGQRLECDGFDVMRNPFGALYNPASILNCIVRATQQRPYRSNDLTEGPRGMHCLDFASRFSGEAESVLSDINSLLENLHSFIGRKPVVFITLGTSFVFERRDTGAIAGNCHKFPADFFTRRMLSPGEAETKLEGIIDSLTTAGIGRIIFTVSPIRHLADGLHGNTLSKSLLQLAVNAITERHPDSVSYFPSYEIMIDDLRDYRFYAADMKHPSQVAVDYIYEYFSRTYFTPQTAETARQARSRYLQSQHRQIL